MGRENLELKKIPDSTKSCEFKPKPDFEVEPILGPRSESPWTEPGLDESKLHHIQFQISSYY